MHIVNLAKGKVVVASDDTQDSPVQVQQLENLDFILSIEAIAGADPKFHCYIDGSNDGDNWVQVHDFTEKTATGNFRASWNDLGHSVPKFLALRWTFAGTTTSVTFSVLGAGISQ